MRAAILPTHPAPLTISSHSSIRLFVGNIGWRQFVPLSLIHVYIVIGRTKRGGVNLCHYRRFMYIWSSALLQRVASVCAIITDTEGLITEYQCVTVSYGIECSFLVIITHECVVHECVIITKKLHSIPYDTVTHWNEVINTYLHRQLTCSFSTFFPTPATMTVKTKVFS